MIYQRKKAGILYRSLLVFLALVICSSGVANFAGNEAWADTTPGAPAAPSVNFDIVQYEPYYYNVLNGWKDRGYRAATNTFVIPGASYSGHSENAAVRTGSYQGRSNILVWENREESWIEYEINVPQGGLYELVLNYHPYVEAAGARENRRPAVLSMRVNGEFPFREARAMPFERLFRDELPVRQDLNGDDIRPRPIEIVQWIEKPFRDADGSYDLPFQWYLAQGTNTIRITGNEPIAIQSITAKPPTVIDDYATVSARYPSTGSASPLTGDFLRIDAQYMTSKNDASIQMQSHQDAYMSPPARGDIVFNSVGGQRWFRGGQTATWEFEVPETGTYFIAMRTLASFQLNKASVRTIMINGKVPFSELLSYQFPYSPKWNGTVLADADGAPFEFYLEKGKNTISLAAHFAPFKKVIIDSDEVLDILRIIDQDLRALTGGQDDRNRTWRAERDYPDILPRLERAAELIEGLAEGLIAVNGRSDNIYQSLLTSVRDINKLLRKPNEIPYRASQIGSISDRVARIQDSLVQSPLQIDSFFIVPAGEELPRMEANWWERLKNSMHNFIYSFTKEDKLSELDADALNVWVNRGRDYVTLLQEMADELFTPEHGIRVKVNLLPNPQLLVLANAAGIQPDVALGLAQDFPIDFAIRNALIDLTSFPDFYDLYDQFAPGAWLPFYYDEKYFAVPETQQFTVMFYRKDILAQLGLGIPDTWEDVYAMLPVLQQNHYNFYFPPRDFITVLYQNGAEFYTPDGMKTALDQPEGFAGFKQWVDLFNIYDLEREVPSFYQHFRRGTMPIGVADYNMFVQLMVAAPELYGWWGIAPVPGVLREDGQVARWSGGGQQAGVIYKSTDKKDLAWEFLKWWVSPDIQERYGSDLEAFNGLAFRWNTSNVEAFSRLPWTPEELNVILESWRWYKEVANMPGSYFIPRELNNAWNRTVVDGMNFRTSLEIAIMDINREFLRKQMEFNFIDVQTGEYRRTLDLPVITEPWEGVEPYYAR